MVSWLLRHYFRLLEHPGKYRVAGWLGRNVFPHQGLPVQVFPGVELLLHPRDWIEYTLLTTGKYEPLSLEFLRLNLALGQSAILAGVNFGLHVAVAARAVGEAGRVIGIEPQPAALLRTFANLKRNGLCGPVNLLSAAIGSDDQFQYMPWSNSSNSGAASFYANGAGLTVQLTTLGAVIRDLLAARPRLLLLDVQGYELNALKGLPGESAPEIVVTELDPEFLTQAQVRPEQLHARLSELGYRLFNLHGVPVAPGDVDIPEKNLIGVREGSVVHWLPPPA
jgi:FkbM family methyltransferase